MPDVDAPLHHAPPVLMPKDSNQEKELGETAIPSILGIWRLGETLHQSDRCMISLGQPADAIDNPRWDYVIKTFSQSLNIWEVKRHVSQTAEVNSRVAHPNLLGSLDASATSNPPYIVMPRLDAMSMQQILHSGAPKPLPVTLWITRQVAEALDAIHQTGWIHGNVTPNHILVHPNGHSTLIDLGMAQKIHTLKGHSDATDRRFASPESLSGDLAAVTAMDIFSLGRILWQWLTITSATPEMMEPVVCLVEAMVSPEPSERPDTPEVVRQLKHLEFVALGQHIGPGRSLQAA